MKRYILFLLVLLLSIGSGARLCAAETETPQVYVIPVEGMIERGLLYVLRRSVAEAVENDAKAIILDMDTPGGRVDAAEDIIRLLIDVPDSIHTCTFVNKDALSAGSMIAVATKSIFMAPGSRIGASAIVTITGDIEEGDMKEKHVSALVALVSSAAERWGHDPELVESMIRKDREYKVGDRVICPEGELLTLNEREAAEEFDFEVGTNVVRRALLSSGTVTSMDELIAAIGLKDAPTKTVTITGAERVARFVEGLSVLLLGGGLLCLFIEFKIPGFGIFGILGIVLLALFFWGHHIVGLSGSAEVLIFVAGVVLLMLEIFVIPGFGIAGVSGIALMLLGIIMAMVEHYPGSSWFRIPEFQIQAALTDMGLALAMACGLALIVARFLPRTEGFKHLVLSADLHEAHGTVAKTKQIETGAVGRAVTPLRPSGLAVFDGKRISVVARGSFIDTDAPIVVAEKHGNRIVVEMASEQPS